MAEAMKVVIVGGDDGLADLGVPPNRPVTPHEERS